MASACLFAMELNSHPVLGARLPSITRLPYCFQWPSLYHSSLSMIRLSRLALADLYFSSTAIASLISFSPIAGSLSSTPAKLSPSSVAEPGI